MGGRKIQVQLECFGSGRMEAPGAPLMLKLQPAEDPSNVKAIRTSEHSRIETKPFCCFSSWRRGSKLRRLDSSGEILQGGEGCPLDSKENTLLQLYGHSLETEGGKLGGKRRGEGEGEGEGERRRRKKRKRRGNLAVEAATARRSGEPAPATTMAMKVASNPGGS
ncbi:hypothetical protein MRB53_001129 [Persea americana]|uniref:Uncharacterized protein n=1 Tax=Persea americana TaxID=3435 RepID=A0ACC2MQZ3_PERAE|nr:hypothetical protein MRB53_001129 [Persea americana]